MEARNPHTPTGGKGKLPRFGVRPLSVMPVIIKKQHTLDMQWQCTAYVIVQLTDLSNLYSVDSCPLCFGVLSGSPLNGRYAPSLLDLRTILKTNIATLRNQHCLDLSIYIVCMADLVPTTLCIISRIQFTRAPWFYFCVSVYTELSFRGYSSPIFNISSPIY